jgi:lysine 2,3-aminomutase
LLRDINDNVDVMKRFMRKLMKMRVKPYYLYQCDKILGSSHFVTPIEKGLEIIKGLRGHTSGYAVPSYVIDAPSGGGKIPLLPEYYMGKDENGVILKNYQDKIYHYLE